MYKIRFQLGLRPRPHLRSLQLYPDQSWLHLRGPISKGSGGEGEGRVNEGEKKGRKKEFAPPPQSSPQIDATADSGLSVGDLLHLFPCIIFRFFCCVSVCGFCGPTVLGLISAVAGAVSATFRHLAAIP